MLCFLCSVVACCSYRVLVVVLTLLCSLAEYGHCCVFVYVMVFCVFVLSIVRCMCLRMCFDYEGCVLCVRMVLL